MNRAVRIESHPYPRGISRLQLVKDFAHNILLPRLGSLYVVDRQELIGAKLLDRNIKNILVSATPNIDTMESQLAQVLNINTKIKTASAIAEPAILFNVPEFLQKGILFTDGKMAQESTDASAHTTITLEDVKKGFTDFGEEMLSFMQLNQIDSIQMLTNLTIPAYQKIGYGGTVSGDKLGMKGDVSRWNTVVIRTKENCGALCFDCIIACPAGAIFPFQTKASPIAGGVKINLDACKGCQQCIDACLKETFWAGVQNE